MAKILKGLIRIGDALVITVSAVVAFVVLAVTVTANFLRIAAGPQPR